MSIVISDEDIAIAWLKAMEHLVEVGHDSNVITIMGPGLSENYNGPKNSDSDIR